MSDLLRESKISDSKDCPLSAAKPTQQILTTRKAQIGDNLTIRRALPHSERRMIGAWCFLDHFGPLPLSNSDGLDIPPHPHIGLQTFTWLMSGKILHRDSLGSEQIIEPEQVNLMTAGYGIAHSEQSIANGILNGVQLWIALPDANRNMQSEFAHYAKIPKLEHDGLIMYVLTGEAFGEKSPVKVYSPLAGFDLKAIKNTKTTLSLNPKFEYGVLPLNGNISIENRLIDLDDLLYLGRGRAQLAIEAERDAHMLLIGGEPFQEEVLLWWNFVARSKQEIMTAAKDWQNHTRFGEVKNYQGQGSRLTAPAFSN